MRDRYYEAALELAQELGYEGTELPSGRRRQADACPLACALRTVIPHALVGRDFVVLRENETLDIAPPVQIFIRRFDTGWYPELIADD